MKLRPVAQKFFEVKIKRFNSKKIDYEALMAQGMNTPQITETLFFSYHTIENHKRILRNKSKASEELTGFVYKYHILTPKK